MKTNHQRQFKDKRSSRAVFAKYYVNGNTKVGVLSDTIIMACATCGDHTNGKRGIAKDVKGAKKFVNSRHRFHENQALKKMSKMLDSD